MLAATAWQGRHQSVATEKIGNGRQKLLGALIFDGRGSAVQQSRDFIARSQVFAEISDIRHLRLFPQRSPNRLIRLNHLNLACGTAAKCDLSHCRHGFFLP
jgi:hypothetical protein